VQIDDFGLSMWPVTWVQLERFLAEPGGRSSRWYQSLFESPDSAPRRGCWRTISVHDREDLFANTVGIDEAGEYVAWLNQLDREGRVWSLPTPRNWRALAQRLKNETVSDQSLEKLLSTAWHPAAQRLAQQLAEAQPRTWYELTLMRGGLFEWVQDPQPGGLGLPRPGRLPTAFDPLDATAPPVRFAQEGRPRLFGFRPVFNLRRAPVQPSRRESAR
jgi:formylglycine-generating enzyme required for sulfatase activity